MGMNSICPQQHIRLINTLQDYDFGAASFAFPHQGVGSHPPYRGGPGVLAGSRQDQMSTAAASAVESLRQGVSRLQTSHHSTQSSLARASGNLTGSLQKIEALEGDLKRASERYIAMQKVGSRSAVCLVSSIHLFSFLTLKIIDCFFSMSSGYQYLE
jgi:hypothetical protein